MLRLSLVLALITAPVILPAIEIGVTTPSVLSQQDTQQTKSPRLPILHHLIEEGKWLELAHQVQKGARNHDISLQDLQMLTLSFNDSPFSLAVLATKNILSLHEKTGLSLSIAFPIALFAETSMRDEITAGKHFWSCRRFGRELQYESPLHPPRNPWCKTCWDRKEEGCHQNDPL
jgi:hypothetical protein